MDFAKNEGGAPSWKWKLTLKQGARQVSENVNLEPGADGENLPDHYRFLTNPYDFIRNRALDDEGEARVLRNLGEWLRRSVLTETIWRALPKERPSTVLVKLNGEGLEREILRYPLALAAEDRVSLADRKLTFVYDVTVEGGRSAVDLGRRAEDNSPLHLVGVFNRTEAGEPLDLHAEQTRVFKTVRRIAAHGEGRDITLSALAYHVTHARLRDRLDSASRSSQHDDGRPWQMILHLADRGVPGSWSAVDASRRKTPLDADTLVDMLQSGGNDFRLRLAVITTRPAGSPSLADQLEKFGIRSLRPAATDTAADDLVQDDQLPVVLARELGCAVLAFRHRIADRSAIDIVETVYAKLLQKHLTLPQALAEAIKEHRTSLEPLDVAAPILYGADACGLRVRPPARERGRYNGGPLRQHPAPRLIGHHKTMWTASEIFSELPVGEVNGAVLYGMDGVGKTTCATELISHYADGYRTVLQYPPVGGRVSADPSEALKDFVAVLLADEAMGEAFKSHGQIVPGPATLENFLGDETNFSQLCLYVTDWLTSNNHSNALVFLSDVKNLLEPEAAPGQSPWLHSYWTRLIAAMTVPKAWGFRLLITSPYPLGLGASMPDVPVPLLAPDEAFLYALSLPRLGKLIGAAPKGVPDKAKRKLVHDVLSLADGHPGLLQYADEAAGKGAEYVRHLADTGIERLAEDEPGQRPRAWREIADWTVDALRRIPCDDPRYVLFLVLCRLRPVHRILLRPQVDNPTPCLLSEIWAALRSGQAGRQPVAEELEELLKGLCRESLIDLIDLPGEGNAGAKVKVRVHPAVADAAGHSDVRLSDGASLRAEVDRIAIQHTAGRANEALRHRLYGGSADVQRLISEALPYLERRGDWDTLLLFMAVLMARSRNNYGLDVMMNRLKRARDRISGTASAQSTMATRLLQVLEALVNGASPGLSTLLGEGPGDVVVDKSPLATAMGAGILNGLRYTGRLQLASEVADDYLQHVEPGSPVSLIASAVETELLRVMVDRGELTQALERTSAVFEALVDVRFRAADHEAAEGEILRKKLFAIRRDSHVLLAEDPGLGAEAQAVHIEQARAAHFSLGKYLEFEGSTDEEQHLHAVDGCLTGLDRRLDGNREQLESYDAELTVLLPRIERSGDIALRAMTDVARARIFRERALRARTKRLGKEEHDAMQTVRDYELKALRQFYVEGTPMDVGACHRRIADDQLACEYEPLTESTPVHQMYAALVGDLTGAYLLRGRPHEREEWRLRGAVGGVPATYQELCERVRGELDMTRGDRIPGVPDPERLLRNVVDDEAELTEAFKRITADV
ncbi:hypothetical protein OG266_10565 [Streptomyces sp. NBC_00554]|uniref:hypothetical protein n=1 Tax=Streptomyces sp. NBC_00554 TaxID=2903661 RepID=UPI00352F787A|nr:hypothetical protein OG266_10565 [Streptomyces sp. NBC_00554]